MSYGVFISYSHEDKDLVTRVVPFVRALRSDLVFQDVDMMPGKPWERQLQGALDEAKMIIVFWCEHSSRSDYVRKEYEKAIVQEKDVLPLLLDDSPLSDPLKTYQWVDFRTIIKHHEESDTSRKGTPSGGAGGSEPPFPPSIPEVVDNPRQSPAEMPRVRSVRFSWLWPVLLIAGLWALFFWGVHLVGQIPFFRNLSSTWKLILRIVGFVMPLIAFVIAEYFKRLYTMDMKMSLPTDVGIKPPLSKEYDTALTMALEIAAALKKRVPVQPQLDNN